jgi:hypothetical protein
MLIVKEVPMALGLGAFLRIRTGLLLECGNVMVSNRESEWEHTARLMFEALMETQLFFVAGEEVTDPIQLVKAVQQGRPVMSVNKKI